MEGYADFDEMIIDMWNRSVKKEDTLLHLGDVGLKEGYKRAQELNGHITLIIGNHDLKNKYLNFYREIGWDIIDYLRLDIDEKDQVMKYLMSIFTKDELNNKLLACWVCDINDKRIMFSHFPIFNNNPHDTKYNSLTKVLEEIYIFTKCDINIHGHTHSAGAKEAFCKSACLELNDFKLLKLEN
ncbi:MAG: metallophosphoesterase family protein [Sulfurospirillaceae bacterium]|nr:metallophosphoesterase family protein [Sulfurospirillaceae bacterium]